VTNNWAKAPMVEVTPPDLTPYRDGNIGIPYVTSLNAGSPGPHVLAVALTHGNEISGAIALDRLLRAGIRPKQGKLTLAFANVAAYQRFDSSQPHRSRCVDEDFNRVWNTVTLDGPRNSAELARARELRPLIESVDALLDLHSMTAPSPPLALVGMQDKSLILARQVGMPEIVMRDPGHAEGTRLRDYGAFGDPSAAAVALLVECGQHWLRATVDFAYDITLRFLATTGIIDGPTAPHASAQRLLDVTHVITATSDHFAFVRYFEGLATVPKAGTTIAVDGGVAISTPYDDCVIIMPSTRAGPGQTAVRFGHFRE
jgi:predicted deacylase